MRSADCFQVKQGLVNYAVKIIDVVHEADWFTEEEVRFMSS